MPVGRVVSKLEVAWQVGMVGQVLEVYLEAELLAFWVLSLSCF